MEYFVSVPTTSDICCTLQSAIEAKGATVFQMPVWNALYQVRDFAQYVSDIRARDSKDQPLPVIALDKSSWQVGAAEGCAVIDYDGLCQHCPGRSARR